MRTTIVIAAFALGIAGCSAKFSSSATSDDKSELDGNAAGDDSMGKPISENDEARSGDAPATGAGGASEHGPGSDLSSPTTPPTSEAKEGDCIPGQAKGHEKDKAQGEAKGHDKPPCPDQPKEPEASKDAGKSDAAKAKTSGKPSDKASNTADKATAKPKK
jgi:hypothetical protein